MDSHAPIFTTMGQDALHKAHSACNAEASLLSLELPLSEQAQACIALLPSVEKLYLMGLCNGRNLEYGLLMELVKLRSLVTLKNLSTSAVKVTTLAWLCNFPFLEKLEMDSFSGSLDGIENSPNLKEVKVGKVASVHSMGNLPKLRLLHLTIGNSFEGFPVADDLKFPLETIKINFSNTAQPNLNGLHKFPNLKRVVLFCVRSREILAGLQSIPFRAGVQLFNEIWEGPGKMLTVKLGQFSHRATSNEANLAAPRGQAPASLAPLLPITQSISAWPTEMTDYQVNRDTFFVPTGGMIQVTSPR